MPLPRDTLLDILKDACRAPSGDNAQPWRFGWDGSVLSIYNIPGIHNPYLDFEERGAYIAHGAFIENLCVATPHYGFEASVKLFPDPKKEDLVAHVHFSSGKAPDDHLYKAVLARATNRHPYKNRPLTDSEHAAFEETVVRFSGVEIALITEKEKMKALAYAASRSEIVILENKGAASHFFKGMVWTQAEEWEKKMGFFVKTLEFNPIQHFAFWLASKPKILRFFCAIGLPHFIANQDAHLYATGSIAGGIFVKNESAECYVNAGRALERLWLVATALGFGFQPLVSTAFIAYRAETGRGSLSPVHVEEMRKAIALIRTVLDGEGKIPAVLFRAGPAPIPSAWTSRRDPDVEFV